MNANQNTYLSRIFRLAFLALILTGALSVFAFADQDAFDPTVNDSTPTQTIDQAMDSMSGFSLNANERFVVSSLSDAVFNIEKTLRLMFSEARKDARDRILEMKEEKGQDVPRGIHKKEVEIQEAFSAFEADSDSEARFEDGGIVDRNGDTGPIVQRNFSSPPESLTAPQEFNTPTSSRDPAPVITQPSDFFESEPISAARSNPIEPTQEKVLRILPDEITGDQITAPLEDGGEELISRPVAIQEAFDNLRLQTEMFYGGRRYFERNTDDRYDRLFLSPLEFMLNFTGVDTANVANFLYTLFNQHATQSNLLIFDDPMLQEGMEGPMGMDMMDPIYGEFQVVDKVGVDKFLAGIHFFLNPPAKLHPYLKVLFYRLFVTDEMLQAYMKKRHKLEEIYQKAQEGEGKIRYKNKIWENPIKPPIDDMGGDYALVDIIGGNKKGTGTFSAANPGTGTMAVK